MPYGATRRRFVPDARSSRESRSLVRGTWNQSRDLIGLPGDGVLASRCSQWSPFLYQSATCPFSKSVDSSRSCSCVAMRNRIDITKSKQRPRTALNFDSRARRLDESRSGFRILAHDRCAVDARSGDGGLALSISWLLIVGHDHEFATLRQSHDPD